MLPSKQYWSGVINIIAGEENPVELDLDQLALNETNNPKPVRFDGVPPVPEREEKRLAGLEGLVGIIAQAAVGYTATPKVYYYLNDHLGTPQIMVDSTGTVVWEAKYKPFGEAQVHPSSTVVNNFRFPGQYYDQETGLHYNYFRDYHPGIGRYVEPDPIGLEGGKNLYLYVENNSVNQSDPIGLHWMQDQRTGYPTPHIHPFCDDPSSCQIVNPRNPGAWPGDPQHENPLFGPCVECNWSALEACLTRVPGPNTSMACVNCAANISEYKVYGLATPPCIQCFGELGVRAGECLTKHCKTGRLDKCGNCR